MGSLHLILGCMFSGKTSELLNRYERYIIGNRKCLLIKYIGDKRYDETCVVAHNGTKVTAFVCERLHKLDHLIENYDIILIDEIQFYEDAFIMCEKWSTIDKKIVHVCGLNGTFERKPFEIISKLIPVAETIVYKTAVCRETSNDAIYSKRMGSNKEEILIGGAELYSAVDRQTFFSSEELEKYKKYLENKLEKLQNKKNNNL